MIYRMETAMSESAGHGQDRPYRTVVRYYDVYRVVRLSGFSGARLYRGIRGGPLRIKYTRTVRRRRQRLQPTMCVLGQTHGTRRSADCRCCRWWRCRCAAGRRLRAPKSLPRAPLPAQSHTHTRIRTTIDLRTHRSGIPAHAHGRAARKIVNSYTYYTRRSSSSVAAAAYIV